MAKIANILFFDSECVLCNRRVDFLLAIDKKNLLQFAPLNGKTFKALISNELAHFDTLVYYSGQSIFTKSNAVIQVLYDLGGIWKLGIVLKLIPAFIRNALYDFVSKNRYKWYGKSTCRVPSAEEIHKFLA